MSEPAGDRAPVQGEVRVIHVNKDGFPHVVMEMWDGVRWVDFDEWLEEDEV